MYRYVRLKLYEGYFFLCKSQRQQLKKNKKKNQPVRVSQRQEEARKVRANSCFSSHSHTLFLFPLISIFSAYSVQTRRHTHTHTSHSSNKADDRRRQPEVSRLDIKGNYLLLQLQSVSAFDLKQYRVLNIILYDETVQTGGVCVCVRKLLHHSTHTCEKVVSQV